MQRRIYVLDENSEVHKIYSAILEPEFFLECFSNLESLSHRLDQKIGCDLLICEANFVDTEQLPTWFESLKRRVGETSLFVVTNLEEFPNIYESISDWACDYLTKPFKNNELVGKCRHIIVRNGLYNCDVVNMKVRRFHKTSESLTSNELRLLTLLSSSRDQRLGVEQATRKIWGSTVSNQRLHTLLSRLRPKIRPLDLQVEMEKDGYVKIFDMENLK
jgi:DNA-binding response OmpR family regulator